MPSTPPSGTPGHRCGAAPVPPHVLRRGACSPRRLPAGACPRPRALRPSRSVPGPRALRPGRHTVHQPCVCALCLSSAASTGAPAPRSLGPTGLEGQGGRGFSSHGPVRWKVAAVSSQRQHACAWVCTHVQTCTEYSHPLTATDRPPHPTPFVRPDVLRMSSFTNRFSGEETEFSVDRASE